MAFVLFIGGTYGLCRCHTLALVNVASAFCVYVFCVGDGYRLTTDYRDLERIVRMSLQDAGSGRHFLFVMIFTRDNQDGFFFYLIN